MVSAVLRVQCKVAALDNDVIVRDGCVREHCVLWSIEMAVNTAGVARMGL